MATQAKQVQTSAFYNLDYRPPVRVLCSKRSSLFLPPNLIKNAILYRKKTKNNFSKFKLKVSFGGKNREEISDK